MIQNEGIRLMMIISTIGIVLSIFSLWSLSDSRIFFKNTLSNLFTFTMLLNVIFLVGSFIMSFYV